MQRPLRQDGIAAGIRAIPLAFRTLGSAGTSHSLPGRRELIWGKGLAMRGKIATGYNICFWRQACPLHADTPGVTMLSFGGDRARILLEAMTA